MPLDRHIRPLIREKPNRPACLAQSSQADTEGARSLRCDLPAVSAVAHTKTVQSNRPSPVTMAASGIGKVAT
jgi:hypothetical protein